MNRVQPLAIALLLLTAGRAMAEPGNAARGERMYRACVACHSLEPNRNMTGPSLAEVWNRKAGSLPSFPRYSPALKSAGIIWTDDTLDEWIKDPAALHSGKHHDVSRHERRAAARRSAGISQ
jgi:cytochrome c